MPQASFVSLIHVAGFLTGIALYAMLGWMTVHTGRGLAAGTGQDRIPFASAILGLLWNLGALLYYGAPDLGLLPASPAIGVVAFSALGFLPAAVVHAAVRGEPRRVRLSIAGAAYLVSTACLLRQALTLPAGTTPDRPALLLLTVGYAAILVVLAWRLREQRNGAGMFAATGLAVFAVMALHLSQHRDGSDSVAMELLGHQGSLPLVLVILYQDYRFAFADLFLKRALALLSLVSLAIVSYLQVISPLVAQADADGTATPGGVGIIIMFAVAMAVVYPILQRATGLFVDRVVLRRADYMAVRQALAEGTRQATSETAALDAVCERLGPALSADDVMHAEMVAVAGDHGGAASWTADGSASVPVITTDAPAFCITIGALRGGRRILSDDLQLMETAALLAARRIDALRLERERFDRAAAELDARRLMSEAELRALRAQLDPHFLFNSLTTIGHLLTEAPDRALSTLLRLTELLRAVLRPSATDLVTLAEELEIVTAYLAIEHARFEERLEFSIDVPSALWGLRIPPLLLQPLVENAVKHGIAPLRRGGAIHLTATLSEYDERDKQQLSVVISDTGSGVEPGVLAQRRAAGVGLRNVEQRLSHQFGARAGVQIESVPGAGTRVRVWLPVSVAVLDVPLPEMCDIEQRAGRPVRAATGSTS